MLRHPLRTAFPLANKLINFQNIVNEVLFLTRLPSFPRFLPPRPPLTLPGRHRIPPIGNGPQERIRKRECLFVRIPSLTHRHSHPERHREQTGSPLMSHCRWRIGIKHQEQQECSVFQWLGNIFIILASAFWWSGPESANRGRTKTLSPLWAILCTVGP